MQEGNVPTLSDFDYSGQWDNVSLSARDGYYLLLYQPITSGVVTYKKLTLATITINNYAAL